MRYTKFELKIFQYIFNKNIVFVDNISISLLSNKINKSNSQIYRILNSLVNKNLISNSDLGFIIYKSEFSIKLGQIISNNTNLIDLFSFNGLDILLSFINNHTIRDVIVDTGYNKDSIYKKLKLAMSFSIIWPEKNKYYINEKVWPNLKDLLLSYYNFCNLQDQRVPINSIIYFKNNSEIIFSNKAININAKLTSFSLFYKFGIKIYNLTNFYYLPKKKLTKKDILIHTLEIVKKTKDFRQRLYLALFYCKYKSEFKGIKHEILDNLNRIFNGEKIERYPPLKEIKEKGNMYNIKI